jgi:4-hydroxy-tetrahydrodipicolinate synthase
VPGVKGLLAHIHADPAWTRVEPPLSAVPAEEQAAVASSYDDLRARGVQAGPGARRAQAG